MICFPNAKINIGLDVLRKRDDQYHDIETVFYPIQLCDILEINHSQKFEFTQSGMAIEGNSEHNLVVKAYRLFEYTYDIGPVHIHLHKQIPFGAGLGGGSSDAAFTLKMLNTLFNLNLTKVQLLDYALSLGSDCPFFIANQPAFASGRGELLEPVSVNINNMHMVLVKPNFGVGTAEAYGGIIPHVPEKSLRQLIRNEVQSWSGTINNQFETNVFKLYPQLALIKETLYNNVAVYAAMSGSGSAVFGLFKKEPEGLMFEDCFVWKEYFGK